jgi:hypothetical protein
MILGAKIMKKNIKTSIFASLFVLLLTFSFIPLSTTASIPCTVSGYVYINDEINIPDEVLLSFPTQDIQADLFPDGFYIVDFNEDVGETGMFYVTYDGLTLTAEETITIEADAFIYEIDLHVYTAPNNPPDKPINPIPENNSENISINPTLSVLVTDPDGDDMDLYFYNATNDTLLRSIVDVENNTRGAIELTNLDYETNYNWYVVVNDSEYETKSDIFTFKTREEDKISPYIRIVKPEPGALYIRDFKLFSNILKQPVIIGKITIELDVIDNETGVDTVGLFVKKFAEKKLKEFTEEPYEYLWSSFSFGKYELIVKAYDNEGNYAEKTMLVKKFF